MGVLRRGRRAAFLLDVLGGVVWACRDRVERWAWKHAQATRDRRGAAECADAYVAMLRRDLEEREVER